MPGLKTRKGRPFASVQLRSGSLLQRGRCSPKAMPPDDDNKRRNLTKEDEILLWKKYTIAKTVAAKERVRNQMIEAIAPLVNQAARGAAERLGYADGENAVAEAFLMLTKNAHYFDPSRSRWSTFAYRVAGQAVSRLWHRERDRLPMADLSKLHYLADKTEWEIDVIETEKVRRDLCQYWLGSMIDDVREVAELTVLAGMSTNAAAKQLGISQAEAKSRHRLAMNCAIIVSRRWLEARNLSPGDLQ